MAAKPSSFINMTIALTAITLVAAFALGFVNKWTEGPIERARIEKQKRAINAVLPEYDNDILDDGYYVSTPGGPDSLQVFPARAGDQPVGVAVRSQSAKGYSGNIFIMVGFDTEGKVIDTYVIEHKETPGLGTKMADPAFNDQFKGKDIAEMDTRVTKDGGEVDAISGATISSRAFSEAVQLAYDTYKTISDE